MLLSFFYFFCIFLCCSATFSQKDKDGIVALHNNLRKSAIPKPKTEMQSVSRILIFKPRICNNLWSFNIYPERLVAMKTNPEQIAQWASFILFLVACYATLQPALSVRRSVCPSFGHTLIFWGFSGLWPRCSCPNDGEASNMAPAHPHATWVAVCPALFEINTRNVCLTLSI